MVPSGEPLPGVALGGSRGRALVGLRWYVPARSLGDVETAERLAPGGTSPIWLVRIAEAAVGSEVE